MRKRISVLLVVLATLVTGCAADYEVGDISKTYCESTSPEFRQMVKDNLAGAGIELGVDYCTTRDFIDAMIKLNKPIDYGPITQANNTKETVMNVAKVQNQNFERQYNF